MLENIFFIVRIKEIGLSEENNMKAKEDGKNKRTDIMIERFKKNKSVFIKRTKIHPIEVRMKKMGGKIT